MYVFWKYCWASSAENSGWAFCVGGWKMLWENLFGSFLKDFSAAILFLCSCFFNNESLSLLCCRSKECHCFEIVCSSSVPVKPAFTRALWAALHCFFRILRNSSCLFGQKACLVLFDFCSCFPNRSRKNWYSEESNFNERSDVESDLINFSGNTVGMMCSSSLLTFFQIGLH